MVSFFEGLAYASGRRRMMACFETVDKATHCPDPVEAVYSHDQPAAEEIEQNEHALAEGRSEQDVGLHEEGEQGRGHGGPTQLSRA